MENIFSSVFDINYEICDIFAMRQVWKENSSFEMKNPRKTSAFLYLCGCDVRYLCADGDVFSATRDSVVYIPAGSTYVSTFFNTDNNTSTYLVEFNINSGGQTIKLSDKPVVITKNSISLAKKEITEAVKVFESTLYSPSALKSAIYGILYRFGINEKSVFDKKFMPVASGIRFIEENALLNVAIAEIAAMCNVSVGCFNRLFKEYSGKSPHRYRLDFKIETAKNMLKNGGIPVEAIAETLMFESSSYFCKIFKKKTGLTPAQYKETVAK